MELSREKNYTKLIGSLKRRIANAKIKAALAVNAELIRLYWDMGKSILEGQKNKGWGTKFVEQLSKDLKKFFPDMDGLSRSNLFYMRKFAEEYPDLFLYDSASKSKTINLAGRKNKIVQRPVGQIEIVQQLVGQIPWGHNIILIDRLDDNEERLWYAQQTIEHGWSRVVLEHQIASNLYKRKNKTRKATNFKKLLPGVQSELAEQALKDPYIFDFLNITKGVNEKNVEDQLTNHITKFLMELGVGFAFVGRQYNLNVGGDDFFIDLLFYHIHLKCYVVIELKMEKFKPEYAGQLNFYLTAVDELLKRNDDNPSVGILLCPSKNQIVAEFSLRNMNKPIGISEYRLTSKLPAKLKKDLPIEKLKIQLENQLKLKKKS
ncbi:MAG: YhcG family protein [Bacteroidota bacterium]|jgi:predicted nuclease of restriction endonuclease-like (RecB) superfamily